MKKILLIIIFILSFFISIKITYAYDFDIKSKEVLLIDVNENKILYEKESTKQVKIASLTKIITAITVIENETNYNKKVTVTNEMLNGLYGYAVAGYKVGDEVTYFELLYALMLPSAADAGQILAYATSGSIEEFSKLMNEKATNIGATNSHFSNPIGEDDNNYSTAYDMYIILKYALNNELFKSLFTSQDYYAQTLGKTIYKTTYTTATKNNLDITNILGSKTGFTDEAGLCLASISKDNNIDLLMIVLGAPLNTTYHIKDTINLYNYYIDNYEYQTLLKEDKLLITLKIKNSFKKEINYYLEQDIKKYVINEYNKDDIKIEYDGIETITSKNKYNDKLGTITIKYQDEIIYTQDIYLKEKIIYYKTYIFYGLLFIIIIYLLRKTTKRKKKKRNRRK